MRPIEERFEDQYIPEPMSGCFLWLGRPARPAGYGQIRRHRGKKVGAHRFAWEMTFGEIPQGMHVLHRCDNPACVNPDHLFLGTAKDNILDCIKKGRKAKHPTAKLSESDVREIKNSNEMTKNLMLKFAVSRSTIQQIRRGLYWRHVGG